MFRDMKSHKKKWVWVLPALWVVVTVGSFFHSGDEHGCFALGQAAFVWVFYVANHFGAESLADNLAYLLPAAVVILALAGRLMDILRIKFRAAGVVYFVFSVSVLFWMLHSFESIEAVRYKHRTLLAPVFTSLNIGLYGSILFLLSWGVTGWLMRRWVIKKQGF